MINQKSINAVRSSVFSNGFRKPLYNSYCFSCIPQTIEHLLRGTGDALLPPDVFLGLPNRYDKVILFLVDAFGWCFFERYKDRYPFLKRVIDQGTASMLTSQFPSTTAAHVTSIHTGKPVGDSGIFEWFYFEPKLDTMIAPLLFSRAEDEKRDTLIGANPTEIYPTSTIYQKFNEIGIVSHIFQHEAYTPSTYSNIVFDGASEVVPYKTLQSGLKSLRNAVVSETNDKSYFFFYYSEIDSIGHEYGPDSPQFEEAMDTFFREVEIFYQSCVGHTERTLFLMTADHGQVSIDPHTIIYLDVILPEILSWTMTNQQGALLAPGGSCRDLFLYIKSEYLSIAHSTISALLKDKAKVYMAEDLIKSGLFGDTIGEELRSRLGNLIILPYLGEAVWWWCDGKFEEKSKGHHGGMAPEEMEIVLLALPI